MTQVPAWFERKFEFNFPVERYPYLCIRLRGTAARLDEIFRGAPRESFITRPKGKWSAQEHAGHLLDLEPLWSARVEDFLADVETLTVADLTNRKTNEANHNGRPLKEILAAFRDARRGWVDRVAKFVPDIFVRARLHPRLKQPMRLVDHLYFVAEHDDHHLARIWEMVQG